MLYNLCSALPRTVANTGKANQTHTFILRFCFTFSHENEVPEHQQQSIDIMLSYRRLRNTFPVTSCDGGRFSSPGSAFCAYSYFGIRSMPVLPQLHVQGPGHSAKSAAGRLQLNTHAPYLCGVGCISTNKMTL